MSKRFFDFGSMGLRYGPSKKKWWGGSRNKSFDETASFWHNCDFFAFWGVLGVRAPVFFSGTPKRAKIPKNRIWGPVEAVSGKFSGDLKVAHGDSATDEPKKSRF